eukprot:TRINITY_DN3093_c0_g1_i4.p1 TRINITY_DN3093_c0_g1~~TRINITY_DN3093_c0_g1_i4.p1  ORF type:complete len:211 (-),score=41.80 TRINITY_DN3093_c0_g1_i4:65-697(-)
MCIRDSADIQFNLGPVDEDFVGEGLQFENKISGGNIPREFIPSVEKGFKMAMNNGVLAGFKMDTLKVTLNDGSFHAVDSDALSFEICAQIGYKESVKKAGPVLLEPIMKVEVVTPEENMGDVMGDLNRRRGQMQGMDSRGTAQVIKCLVPLSEMFGYVTQLRTITSVSYTHLRAHETVLDLVCRLLLEKKKIYNLTLMYHIMMKYYLFHE